MSSFAPLANLIGADNGLGQAYAGRTNSDQTVLPDADRRVRGDSRNTTSRSVYNSHGDWLQEQMLKRTPKQIANATGMTPRGAENLRLGESKISFDKLVELCQNDPLFRAEFFKYCGGHLETSPSFYAHMSQAFSHIMAITQQGMAE